MSQFLHQPIGQFVHSGVGYQRDGAPRLALGTINVIFAKPRGNAGTYSGVMSMVSGPSLENRSQTCKKAKMVAIGARAHDSVLGLGVVRGH